MVLCLPDSWSNWNFEMLVFEGRGKLEYLLPHPPPPPQNTHTHTHTQKLNINQSINNIYCSLQQGLGITPNSELLFQTPKRFQKDNMYNVKWSAKYGSSTYLCAFILPPFITNVTSDPASLINNCSKSWPILQHYKLRKKAQI